MHLPASIKSLISDYKIPKQWELKFLRDDEPQINIPKTLRADLTALITVMGVVCAEVESSTERNPELKKLKVWFCRQALLLAECGLYRYPATENDVVDRLTSSVLPIQDILNEWVDISWQTIGPHSLAEIVMKISLLPIQETVPSVYLEACQNALRKIMASIPETWIPAYAIFFRVANGKLEMATNYHVPGYLKRYNHESQKGPSPPRKIRQLFFPARCSYIKEFEPFAAEAEEAFNAEMERQGIREIHPGDKKKRQILYNLHGPPHTQANTHLWSMAIHLPDVTWGLPCARCEFVHKSMTNYETAGRKTVTWRHEYSPLNCGESLAIAMSLQMMKQHQLY